MLRKLTVALGVVAVTLTAAFARTQPPVSEKLITTFAVPAPAVPEGAVPDFAITADHPTPRPSVSMAAVFPTTPNPAYNGRYCGGCLGPRPSPPAHAAYNGVYVPGLETSADLGWYSLPDGSNCTDTGPKEAAGTGLVVNPACSSSSYRRAHGEWG